MATREELEARFTSLGINYRSPGFYDDENFLAEERRDNKFLATYASYVEVRSYTAEYLQHVREVVLRLSTFLFNELQRDERLGACVDISGAFARMLDEEGIWAYPVAGGVSVGFPQPTGDRYFGAISRPGENVEAGHMWVRVPPFQAVDISFALQPWGDATHSAPEGVVIIETFAPHVPTIYELVDMDFLRDLKRAEGMMPNVRDVLRNKPHLVPFMREFAAFESPYGTLPIAYVPTAVKMSQMRLQHMKNPILNGLEPPQVYAKYRASLA